MTAQPKTTGTWPAEKFERWYREHPVIAGRDYQATLVPRIQALSTREGFTVTKYGEATYTTANAATGNIDNVTHDLFYILVGDFDAQKPTYIVIGGTHGYEKGGPLAALGFAEEEAANFAATNNIIIYPCLCPGPYEKELRYTEGRIDPNRDAIVEGAKSNEMRAFAASLKDLHHRLFGGDLSRKFAGAIDLHETPRMDIDISRESAEMGGETFTLDDFPEGFFVMAFRKDEDYARRIIHQMKKENHIVIETPEICGDPNDKGVVFIDDIGIPPVLVHHLTLVYAEAAVTTEYSGIGITDDMPDRERAEPQRAAIRGMLAEPLLK